MLLALSIPCLAVDNLSSIGKNHTLGINLGLGGVDTDISSETDESESVIGVIYGYQYSSIWAINTGMISAESFCIITCLKGTSIARTLGYDSYLLNIKGSLNFSNRWSMFGKLGVNYYDLEFSGGQRIDLTDSGVGGLLATGFDFRAHNGFGFGIEATWLDMGNVSATNYTINLSYMF